jgi:hypothetical protein
MFTKKAESVDQYVQSLSSERREAIKAVRAIILNNLPHGFVETMNRGMISYEVPRSTFPNTYNKKPLTLAGLVSTKTQLSLYLMSVYSDPKTYKWFQNRYKASGKKLDMGKSCVHFKRADDLPLDLLGETIALFTVEEYIRIHENARKVATKRKGK